MDTMNKLADVFREVFDDPAINLKPEMTTDDVEGWDSLTHINLIMAVENHFNVRFNNKELMSFRNVGDLANCVDSKLNK